VFLKRYVFPVAAALAFALGVTGVALAKGNSRHGHPVHGHRHGKSRHHHHHAPARLSLMPSFAPHPLLWLKPLSVSTHHPKPAHHARPAHHAKAARPRHARPYRRHAPKPQPSPARHLHRTTASIYEHSARRWTLSRQGCQAGRRHENGVVVLDFGKPSFAHRAYGTILFSGRFASNRRITAAMLGYARGYVRCLPHGSIAHITLARGTSNYHPHLPSVSEAGVRWARATNLLDGILRRRGLAAHVTSAAADDAEPAWDPGFRKTRAFIHGFRSAARGHSLYDYGSLDGGIGAVWSARQAWYVAGGIRHTKALPEIYNSAMAQEWAELARIARRRYHQPLRFAGVMTQGTPSCACGLRPHAAHRILEHALASQGVHDAVLPRGGTNIAG
jgi:hypothetical protein